MANNQYTNRVDVMRGNATETLIDITDTTAVAADVAQGKYFYLASGEKVAGTSSGGGGGADVFIVNIDFSSVNPTFDKTFNEIMTAWNESPLIFGLTTYDDLPNQYYNCYISVTNEGVEFLFAALSYIESGYAYIGAVITDNGQTGGLYIPLSS